MSNRGQTAGVGAAQKTQDSSLLRCTKGCLQYITPTYTARVVMLNIRALDGIIHRKTPRGELIPTQVAFCPVGRPALPEEWSRCQATACGSPGQSARKSSAPCIARTVSEKLEEKYTHDSPGVTECLLLDPSGTSVSSANLWLQLGWGCAVYQNLVSTLRMSGKLCHLLPLRPKTAAVIPEAV